VFYGNRPAPEAIPNIQAPGYGFYAGTDARINATVPATQEQMKAAGKFFGAETYEGATHGFHAGRSAAGCDGSQQEGARRGMGHAEGVPRQS